MSTVDEGLAVVFRMDSVLDEAATAATEKKVPVFKDIPWVRIIIPGNKDEIIDTVAWIDDSNDNAHNRRFPHAWARFQSNQTDTPPGYILKECPWVLRSQVEHLAYFGIHTVEQLANVSDANCQNIAKGLEMRTKAREFLEQANSAQNMSAQLEALKAELASLKQSKPSEPLLSVIPQSVEKQVLAPEAPAPAPEAAQAAAPKRRGRPPKANTAQP